QHIEVRLVIEVTACLRAKQDHTQQVGAIGLMQAVNKSSQSSPFIGVQMRQTLRQCLSRRRLRHGVYGCAFTGAILVAHSSLLLQTDPASAEAWCSPAPSSPDRLRRATFV